MEDFKKWSKWQTDGFIHDCGVRFLMEGFRDNVTIDELNEFAVWNEDDNTLDVREDLIPDVSKVHISGFPKDAKVKIGDITYKVVLDRII